MKTFNEIIAPRCGNRDGDLRGGRPAGGIRRAAAGDRMSASPGLGARMFDKILIANRGEIALRILRACKELGIADGRGPFDRGHRCHACAACRRKRLHRPAAGARQLSQHPLAARRLRDHGGRRDASGLRILPENARFAEILIDHDIVFIGPKPEHIRLMGDKIEAKRTAKRLGIPWCPARRRRHDDDEARRIAAAIGYPVLVKAAAGGGGRGMKVARGEAELMSGCRRPRARPRPPSATSGLSRKISSRSRATSRSRCSATGKAAPSASASGTAPCNAGIRKSGRKGLRPRSTKPSAGKSETVGAAPCARFNISAPEPSSSSTRTVILLHRDEHAHPGGASGDRDDHRHRSRQRADPHRRGLGTCRCEQDEVRLHGPRHRMSGQRRKPTQLSSFARPHRLIIIRRAASEFASNSAVYQGYSIPPTMISSSASSSCTAARATSA